jgi:hypothetical protein
MSPRTHVVCLSDSAQVKYYGFKTVAKGFRYVEFRDGTRIELHYPQYYIKNVVYGSSRPRAEVCHTGPPDSNQRTAMCNAGQGHTGVAGGQKPPACCRLGARARLTAALAAPD